MISRTNSADRIRAEAPDGDQEEQRASERAQELFQERIQERYAGTDRMFALLMAVQCLMGIVAAAWISPFTWSGGTSEVHVHMFAAILLGGGLSGFPIFLALRYPGRAVTRTVIAIAQMLTSALLIHLTGGRIETHFHVFGSLAFLAVYRDWRILCVATLVISLDHIVRGIYWPESVYGVLTSSPWRTLEHAGWVLFEVVVLVFTVRCSLSESQELARHTADLEDANQRIEARAAKRAKELEHAQLQLLHAEKLAAVGGLAAGIAHEINTPTQFVGDNVRACEQMFRALERLIVGYRSRIRALVASGVQIPEAEELAQIEQETDADYVFEDAPLAIEQTLEGVNRIRTIVSAMKYFSHGGISEQKTAFDVNEAIRNTLTVARNEIKYVATVELNLVDLPEYLGYPSELNQVFLNLLVNAAHAIADTDEGRGTILVQTDYVDGDIEIAITDTGYGIPDDICHRVFEPFFTTKSVGKGTGQGLAIAYQIVTERHGGSITFQSVVGRGTTFVIRLPMSGATEFECADNSGSTNECEV